MSRWQWNFLSLDFLQLFIFAFAIEKLLENYEYSNSNNHEEF